MEFFGAIETVGKVIDAVGVATIALGGVLFWQRDAMAHVQGTFPKVLGADELYTLAMKRVDTIAVEITARTQRGSLASYTSIVLVVVVRGLRPLESLAHSAERMATGDVSIQSTARRPVRQPFSFRQFVQNSSTLKPSLRVMTM